METDVAQQRLEFLVSASAVLASSLDLAATLDGIARLVVPTLADYCTLDVADEHGALRRVAAAHVDAAGGAVLREIAERYPTRPERPEGLAAVLHTGEPLLVPVISPEALAAFACDEGHRALLHALGPTSGMALPLAARGQTFGVLSFAMSTSGRRYTPDDLALARELAARVGAALDNARLYAAERHARERLALLANASEVLASSLDWETTLQNVVGLAMPAVADFGFFDVVEPDGQVRRIARAHDDPATQDLLAGTRWQRSERRDRNLCALSSGEAGVHPAVDDAWLEDVAAAPEHLALMRALAFGSMLTVPLRYHDRVLGALTLFYGRSGRRHTPADLALAEEIARRAAAAVENARLFREAREAVALRDEFLSIAGHELNTPLTALGLHLASIQRARTPEAVPAKVDAALRQVRRLGKLVEELLDVTRITSGRLVLEREPVDLAALTREAIDRLAADGPPVTCAVRVDAAAPVLGEWDRLRLDQVVTNLVANAVKYGRGSPVEVRVTGDAASARLVVRDRGIGIAPALQGRIFQKFGRAVSSRHYSGLGLGLWIVHKVVEAHGGAIAVESAEGEGSTFEITLPRGPAD